MFPRLSLYSFLCPCPIVPVYCLRPTYGSGSKCCSICQADSQWCLDQPRLLKLCILPVLCCSTALTGTRVPPCVASPPAHNLLTWATCAWGHSSFPPGVIRKRKLLTNVLPNATERKPRTFLNIVIVPLPEFSSLVATHWKTLNLCPLNSCYD